MESFGDDITTIEVDGHPYRFSALRVGQIHQLQRYLDSLPLPPAAAPDRGADDRLVAAMAGAIGEKVDLAALPPEKQDAHLARMRSVCINVLLQQGADARSSTVPEFGTAESLERLVGSYEGTLEIAVAAFSAHQPEMTREQVTAVFDRMRPWQVQAMIGIFLRFGPHDPKAAGGGP